jgi:hypothetical protein
MSSMDRVTSRPNAVARYRYSHALRAITIESNTVSYEPRALTLRSYNFFHMPRAITIKNDNFLHSVEAICDNAKCNIALSLFCCNTHVNSFFYTSKYILDNSILHQYHFIHMPSSQTCMASQVCPRGQKSGCCCKKR